MPAETLQLFYSTRPRRNRRRPKHPKLRAIARIVLWMLVAGIVIAILYKLGVFQESERPVYVATGFPLSTAAQAPVY